MVEWGHFFGGEVSSSAQKAPHQRLVVEENLVQQPSLMTPSSTVNTANVTGNELFNLTSNETQTIVYDYPPYLKVTSITLCAFILLFGVVGNVMVPVVILRTKDMRNSTNVFLMNLSLADLLVLLICTPTVMVELNSKPDTWVLGEFLCKYAHIFKFCFLYMAYRHLSTLQ